MMVGEHGNVPLILFVDKLSVDKYEKASMCKGSRSRAAAPTKQKAPLCKGSWLRIAETEGLLYDHFPGSVNR